MLQLTLDGAPMRLFADSRAANVDVYTRTILARNANGDSLRSFPVLPRPPSSNASGILSTIPINELYLDELTSTPGFKLLLINCDGANTNRKAVRMLMIELQPMRELLTVVMFCAAHGLNNAVRWGLGLFSYGNILRSCHVLQSAKHRKFEVHVKAKLRLDIEEGGLLLSNTAVDYARAVENEYGGLFEGDTPCHQPSGMDEETFGLNRETKTSENTRLWRRFIRLVTGVRGPFAKIGKRRIPDLV